MNCIVDAFGLPVTGSTVRGRRSIRLAAYAANNCLVHRVNPIRSMVTDLGKAEFGAQRAAGNANWQMPAEIAFDVRSFISFASGAPGIDSKDCKITRFALAAVGARDEILGYLPSRSVWYPI